MFYWSLYQFFYNSYFLLFYWYLNFAFFFFSTLTLVYDCFPDVSVSLGTLNIWLVTSRFNFKNILMNVNYLISLIISCFNLHSYIITPKPYWVKCRLMYENSNLSYPTVTSGRNLVKVVDLDVSTCFLIKFSIFFMFTIVVCKLH